MRKLLLSLLTAAAAISASAQSVATFDALPLPHADTFYVNYSAFGTDVGFNDGLAHFPCVYDTSFGFTYWREGFAYSNMTDNTTPGFGNQYSAITGAGYGGSANYIVGYGGVNKIIITGAAMGKPVKGFYVTNSTYAYLSMRDGDAFAKKFGGPDGTDPDWFKLVIKGYSNGQLTSDSVKCWLADFRSADSTKDTIVSTWKWVNLLPLGNVDSLQFSLSSSDNGMFGMNTPAYFCIDDFTTHEGVTGIEGFATPAAVKIYPNPAIDQLNIDAADGSPGPVAIYDLTGKLVRTQSLSGTHNSMSVADLPAGAYVLQLNREGKQALVRFVKQ